MPSPLIGDKSRAPEESNDYSNSEYHNIKHRRCGIIKNFPFGLPFIFKPERLPHCNLGHRPKTGIDLEMFSLKGWKKLRLKNPNTYKRPMDNPSAHILNETLITRVLLQVTWDTGCTIQSILRDRKNSLHWIAAGLFGPAVPKFSKTDHIRSPLHFPIKFKSPFSK